MIRMSIITVHKGTGGSDGKYRKYKNREWRDEEGTIWRKRKRKIKKKGGGENEVEWADI